MTFGIYCLLLAGFLKTKHKGKPHLNFSFSLVMRWQTLSLLTFGWRLNSFSVTQVDQAPLLLWVLSYILCSRDELWTFYNQKLLTISANAEHAPARVKKTKGEWMHALCMTVPQLFLINLYSFATHAHLTTSSHVSLRDCRPPPVFWHSSCTKWWFLHCLLNPCHARFHCKFHFTCWIIQKRQIREIFQRQGIWKYSVWFRDNDFWVMRLSFAYVSKAAGIIYVNKRHEKCLWRGKKKLKERSQTHQIS